MSPTRAKLLLLALAPLAAGCDSLFHGFSVLPPDEPPRPPALIDAHERLARTAPADPRMADLLDEAPRASFVLVSVEGEVAPHFHRQSDETIYILEGEGDLLLDRVWHPVRAGMLIHVPMNLAHGYVNRAPGGTKALVVYSPTFVDGDRVPLQTERP